MMILIRDKCFSRVLLHQLWNHLEFLALCLSVLLCKFAFNQELSDVLAEVRRGGIILTKSPRLVVRQLAFRVWSLTPCQVPLRSHYRLVVLDQHSWALLPSLRIAWRLSPSLICHSCLKSRHWTVLSDLSFDSDASVHIEVRWWMGVWEQRSSERRLK